MDRAKWIPIVVAGAFLIAAMATFAGEQAIAPVPADVVISEDTVGSGPRVMVRTYAEKDGVSRYVIKVTAREGSMTSRISAEIYIGSTLVGEIHLRKSPDAERECQKVAGGLIKMIRSENLCKVQVWKRDSQKSWQCKEFVEDPTAPAGGDIEVEAEKALQ